MILGTTLWVTAMSMLRTYCRTVVSADERVKTAHIWDDYERQKEKTSEKILQEVATPSMATGEATEVVGEVVEADDVSATSA